MTDYIVVVVVVVAIVVHLALFLVVLLAGIFARSLLLRPSLLLGIINLADIETKRISFNLMMN